MHGDPSLRPAQRRSQVLTMPDGQTPGAETLLEFDDNRLVRDLCGPHNAYLVQVESFLGVQILHRGNVLAIHGEEGSRARAAEALSCLLYTSPSPRD